MAADVMSDGICLQFLFTHPWPSGLAVLQSLFRFFVSRLLSRREDSKGPGPSLPVLYQALPVPKKGGSLHLFGPLPSRRVPCCSSFQNGVGFGYCWWRGSLGPHHSSGGCLSVCLWRCFPALPGLCCERSSDCFTLLPFGLSVAPWAFTCVIRPLEGICYRWGQLLYSYLDPFFHLDSNHGVLGYASPSESVPVSWVTSRCWEVPPDSFPLLVCLSVLFHLDSALSPSGLHGPFHLPLDVSHHMSCHGLDFRPAPSTVPPSPSLWGSFASVPWWLGCPSSPLLFPGMFLTPLDHWTLSVWLEVDFLVRLSLCPCLFWLCGS